MQKHPQIENVPGLQWRARADYWAAVWVARGDLAKRGYAVKLVRLWPPTEAKHAALGDEVIRFLQSECARLQNEMLAWAHGGEIGEMNFDGTLNGLIRCYQHDPDSPYHDLRWKSKASYGQHMTLIERTVGGSALTAIRGRHFKRWFEKWSEPAVPGGPRRVATAHAAITMLRILFGFGKAILEDEQCARLKSILEELEFERGRRRSTEITAEQAAAVRAKAHELGFPSIALAQALQFELVLRQKDVIGEWVPVEEPGLSSITSRGKKWLCGLDWREVSPDLVLTHRLSKSLRGRKAIADVHAGKIKTWRLPLYPMIMEELALVPAEGRAGPMVINESTGRPYVYEAFRERWREIATAAGVPKNVQNRDSRAGGITEAIETSDIEEARVAAGHSDIATTQIYSRGDDRRTAKVAVLRAKGRDKKGT